MYPLKRIAKNLIKRLGKATGVVKKAGLKTMDKWNSIRLYGHAATVKLAFKT